MKFFIDKKYTHFLRQFLLGAMDAMLFVGLIVAGFFLYGYFSTPIPDLNTRQIHQTTILYDSSGQHVLYEIHGEENRKIVSAKDIPEFVRVATIVAEDAGFYSHFGIEPKSILRAMLVNYQSHDIIQGGSTITQQLARNAFLTREKSWKRKFKEIFLAIRLEIKYSKEDILLHYLNEVPYGSNAYGIEAASEVFFGKPAAMLTLDEAVFLAALPKAPTYYSPYNGNKPKLVFRQKMILRRIGELGLMKQDEISQALKTDTISKVVPFRNMIEFPHFVMYVKEQLGKVLTQEQQENGGFKVVTTLDYDLQKKAEALVKEKALYNKVRFGAENAALVAIDTKSGEILAMAGSRDFFDQEIDGQVNVATSLRSPGSSFKPIVYAKAFEKGYQPETLLFDVRTDFGPDGSGKNYIPNNYDGKFHGLVSMRQALSMSLNIPAVKTLYLAGVGETIELAQRLGITTLDQEEKYGLSLAIGGSGVTLLQETAAFSVFANEGYRNEPIAIREFEDRKNKKYAFPAVRGERVLDENVCRKINSILSDNGARAPVFGNYNLLNIPGRSLAAKSGTSQDFRDGWTVGYSPSIAVGVWTGNNNNSSMKAGAYGALVAGAIWNDFMRYALERYPVENFNTYQPVKSDRMMVTGNFDKKISYYKKGSGKEISPEKALKRSPDKVREVIDPEKHEVIFYVNRDNPLGSMFPDLNDPMLLRWEQSLQESYLDSQKQNTEGVFPSVPM